MDLNLLKGFLADLPCKFCLDTNTNVTYSYLSSFVVKVQIQCFSCDESTYFKSSKSIIDESTNRSFSDINRRMVRTFSSMGKGHMAMETFCMGMNMPCISHSSYDKQIVKVAKKLRFMPKILCKKPEKKLRRPIQRLKAY